MTKLPWSHGLLPLVIAIAMAWAVLPQPAPDSPSHSDPKTINLPILTGPGPADGRYELDMDASALIVTRSQGDERFSARIEPMEGEATIRSTEPRRLSLSATLAGPEPSATDPGPSASLLERFRKSLGAAWERPVRIQLRCEGWRTLPNVPVDRASWIGQFVLDGQAFDISVDSVATRTEARTFRLLGTVVFAPGEAGFQLHQKCIPFGTQPTQICLDLKFRRAD